MHSAFRKPILAAVAAALMLAGCAVPGAPYGVAVVPPVPPPLPGVYVGGPGVAVAPVYVRGCGYGYWYGGRYWAYRRGWGFYHGRYYARYHRGYYWR